MMHADVSAFKGAFDRFNLLHIQWHIGNYCNYRCSYCNDGLRDGSKPFIPIDVAKKFVTSVTKQARARGKQVEFTISGGEPTVYGELPQLLAHIYECDAFAHIITNGSRSPAYYTRIAPMLTHGAIFTYHSDHAKLDKFLEVVQIMDPRLVMVYIPMNMKKWDECVEAYRALSEIGIRAVPKTVFDDFGFGGGNTVVMYSKAQRDFINGAAELLVNQNVAAPKREVVAPLLQPNLFPRKSPTGHRTIEIHKKDGTVEYTTSQNLIINKQNDFRGMKCNVGLEFLLIGFGGAVVKANCRPSWEIIADISQNPEFLLPTEPITCDVASCWCEGDLLATKFNP